VGRVSGESSYVQNLNYLPEKDVKAKHLMIVGVICFGSIFSLILHNAMANPSTVSFEIHNNQSDIVSLEVYDASDMNNPHLIKTIANLKSGSTTSPIKISTIPGASVGRANWKWDGNETNKINVKDAGIYELSSGAARNE
jgi:hypothetical protein